MKKYLALGLVLFGLFALPAFADTPTAAQLQAMIAQLMSQLSALQGGQPSGNGFCYTFNQNLRVGDNNNDVFQLYRALFYNRTGVLPNDYLNQFDEHLASDLVAFQEKYAAEVLTPNGLARGTGYVGPSTRAKLNQLYGCNGATGNTGKVQLMTQSNPSILDQLKNATYNYRWTMPIMQGDVLLKEEPQNDVFKLENGDKSITPANHDNRRYTFLNYASGDLNSDGQVDAAVLMARSSGANLQELLLFALIKDNGVFRQAAFANVGKDIGQPYDVRTVGLTIKSGIISLNLLLLSEADKSVARYMQQPSLSQIVNYKLIGSQLVRS